ncbi:3180_t:CDS:2 [Paraglomus occultum]|uniref:3180_t:CDS:1 n=1 Tax=Paraglomus occultum TaxID=144539 RepID=A0A9N8WHE0_9GLOM|nr:3180_t:CDS:2 [Paraglomus occultum]
MPKHEFLTPKAIANRIKAKGLQKLRWYCQMCQKQCRDENGFQCHIRSESHQRQMGLFSESPEMYMQGYSKEFLDDFIKLLSRRWGTKRVHANLVYQEYISDRHHLHMNATQWETLTDFVKYLGKQGICAVDETSKGWFIAWIDNSPKALARQEAILKKERQEQLDEEQSRRMIDEQVERATKEAAASGMLEKLSENYTELKREAEEEKITLNISATISSTPASTITASSNSSTTPTSTSATPSLSLQKQTQKKSLSALIKESNIQPHKPQPPKEKEQRKLTAMEQIILEETERKKSRLKSHIVTLLNETIYHSKIVSYV